MAAMVLSNKRMAHGAQHITNCLCYTCIESTTLSDIIDYTAVIADENAASELIHSTWGAWVN